LDPYEYSCEASALGTFAALGLGWLIVALSGCAHGSHAQAAMIDSSARAPTGWSDSATQPIAPPAQPG
jgi:hypothetical protein